MESRVVPGRKSALAKQFFWNDPLVPLVECSTMGMAALLQNNIFSLNITLYSVFQDIRYHLQRYNKLKSPCRKYNKYSNIESTVVTIFWFIWKKINILRKHIFAFLCEQVIANLNE